MYIIIGLGNPGRDYAKTRHNVGFMTLDTLAEREGIAFNKSGFNSVYGEGRIGSEKVILAKPETFMNNSGFAVVRLVNWFKLPTSRIIVIYDDIDLPCGAMRIRENGSAGTHNGMRSIIAQLGSDDFIRIRIGIGKPRSDLINFVLGVPSEDEKKLLNRAFSDASEAIKLIVGGRLSEAQSAFNYKPPKKPKSDGLSGHREKLYSPSLCLSADSALNELKKAHETFFLNTNIMENPFGSGVLNAEFPYGLKEIEDAEARNKRFAPFILKLFHETKNGIIESPLHQCDALRRALTGHNGTGNDKPDTGNDGPGRLFIKLDSELPIAGSVKARGGIYEVLKHTEDIALEAGFLTKDKDGNLTGYEQLDEHKEFFSRYSVQVGSTGNLGLSIGIISAAIGYCVSVHMSSDAKQWKKDLLRSKGVTVIEYDGDYRAAVEQGRIASANDKMSYFIDDERSYDLFFGYATAALRLKKQLEEANVTVDAKHPLFVHIPCGVGGAPGGITFGLKAIFGENVHCFFIEPVNAACMLAAFASGHCIPISELGLSGKTEADGLAVGCASELVYSAMKPLMDGEFTFEDKRLIPYQKLIHGTEGLFVEPSAASALAGAMGLASAAGRDYLAEYFPENSYRDITEILWATGGKLVPNDERRL